MYNIRPKGHIAIWYDRKLIEKDVVFHWDSSSQIKLKKLFGIGFLFSLRKEVAVFEWAYSPRLDKIKIYAAVYSKGIKVVRSIVNVPFGHNVKLKLHISKRWFKFDVSYNSSFYTLSILRTNSKKISYPINK